MATRARPCPRAARLLLLALALAAALAAALPSAGAARPRGPKNGRLFTSSNRTTGSWTIWSFSASGSSPRQVVRGLDFAAHPALSPNGSLLAFTGFVNGSWDVYVASAADGSGMARLTNGTGLSMVPAWSPDGSLIAFESDREDASGKGFTAIYVMPAAPGAPATRLTFSHQNDMGAKFSPDGKTIAFASDRSGAVGLYDIYYTPSSGGEAAHGNASRLTRGLNNSLSRSFSPDGAWLAANSQNAARAGRIALVNASSGDVTPLTDFNDRWPVFSAGGFFPNLQGAATPAFSPDGKWVAFVDQAGPDGGYEIFVARADATGRRRSKPRRLTHGNGAEMHVTLAWQPVWG